MVIGKPVPKQRQSEVPTWLLMTCALITSLEDQLKTDGCRGLNGTPIDATAGINLCKEIIAKAQK